MTDFSHHDDPALHRELSQADIEAYAAIARQDSDVALEAINVARLLATGLIVPAVGREVPYRAVDPAIAIPQWQQSLYRESRRVMDASERVRDLGPVLEKEYRRTAPAIQYGGVEFITEAREVNARLDALVEKARVEMCTAQPFGPRSPEDIQKSYRRDSEVIRRGVQMRTLYLHTVRGDASTAGWARTMTKRGVQIRTLARTFQRMILIDRRVAAISDLTSDKRGHALIIHDPRVVAWFAAHYDAEWELASEWDGTDADEDPVLTFEQESILQGLAEGLDAATIGKRLRPPRSARTVEARKSALRELSGADNDFQLGMWWMALKERARRNLQ